MQFRDLCPVWIISTLDKESGDAFAKRMERQLVAFSKNELGSSFDVTRDRWWRIDSIENDSDLEIDTEGYPSDVPVYRKKDGDNVNTGALNVILFGSNEDFGKCISAAKTLNEKRADNVFMIGNAARVRFYGLLSFKKGDQINTDLVKLLTGDKKGKSKTRSAAEFPFDSVFLQGSCNRTSRNGTDFCYPDLIDAKTHYRNDWDLAIQVIFHLALSDGTLSHVNNERLNVVGAFSLNYEPEKKKHSLAIRLTNGIIKKFSDDELGEHWFNRDEAGLSHGFEDNYGWKSVYGQLKLGYKDLETSHLIPNSKVSPWRLLLRELIPYYFKKYIRGLVRNVHDSVDGFSDATTLNYANHVDNQFDNMTRDSELRAGIENELSTIWEKENVDNTTVGMKQFLSILEKMTEFFKEQKRHVKALHEAKTADGKHHAFPDLKDYPLGNFGEFHESYAKHVRNNPNGAAEEDDATGNKLLQKVVRTLSFHPVPLSILVRSVLAGLLLPMVILVILRLIPDTIINTGTLENTPGCYWFSVACFLLCVGWAVVKYGLGVIDRIKYGLKNYVGWVLYRTQLSAYHCTLKKEIEYYDKCMGVCNEIRKNADAFTKETIDLKEDTSKGFDVNMFQADILSAFKGHHILKDGVVMPKILTVINRHGVDHPQSNIIPDDFEKVEDELLYGIFRKTVIIDSNNGVKAALKAMLFEKSTDSDQNVNMDIAGKKTNLCVLLSENIAKTIQFHVLDREIQSLADIMFDRTGKSNLKSWVQGQDNDFDMGDIIKQRSSPSAEVAMGSFEYAGLVFPDSSEAADWKRVLRLTDQGNRYDICKGCFSLSVLQGLSVYGLDEVRDIKMA